MTKITIPVTLPILAFSTTVIIIMLLAAYGFMKSDGPKSKGRFILVLISAALSVLFFVFIAGFWEYLGLMKPANSVYQLGIIPLFVIAYLLMGLNVVALAKWKNDGNLLYPARGLHSGLRIGFGFGLSSGIISGVAIELFAKSGTISPSSGTIVEMLIICTAVTLTTGYLLGAIFGFIAEFRARD